LVDAYVSVVTYRPPTLSDGAYCNALLLAHWSLSQKLNHFSSVQFSSATSLCTRFKACLEWYLMSSTALL